MLRLLIVSPLAASLLLAPVASAQTTPAAVGPASTAPHASYKPQTSAPKAKKEKPLFGARKIRSSAFGIHSFQTKPQVPAGAIRMNCDPTWRTINPSRGKYVWDDFDRLLERVESWGYRDIIYTFCGTPEWAAKKVARPDDNYHGPGSTGAPKKMRYWKAYVKRVAMRYRGRITAYETWNEATSRFLYQGTPKQMAKMTAVAYRTIRRYDPDARILSANAQASRQANSRDWFFKFFPPYIKYLKKKKWPVDAISVHSYDNAQNFPSYSIGKKMQIRHNLLSSALSILKKYHPPKRVKVWDTETNSLARYRVRGQRALVARTYLDSFRLGIERTYWYMWTDKPDPWMGTQMLPGSVSIGAFTTVRSWTLGQRMKSCTTTRRLVRCRLKPNGSQIVWSIKGKSTYRFSGRRKVCTLTNNCRVVKNKLTVRYSPVRVTRKH